MKPLPCKKCNKVKFETIPIGPKGIKGELYALSCACPRKTSVVISASKRELYTLWNRSQHE